MLSDPSDRSSPRDWYVAFSGKKAPGNGRAQLPYPLSPPFGIEARMGVFTERALAASDGAEGCIGLDDTESSDELRLCIGYDEAANKVVIAFGAEDAECPDASRAALRLSDDGMNVTASYRCADAGPFIELDTVASLWEAGERWNAFVSAAGLVKGGEVAFDDFVVTSEVPLLSSATDATFEAFQLAIEGAYEIEGENFNTAFALASEAEGKIQFAANASAGSGAGKLLAKAASSHGKLLASETKYIKSLVKTAGLDASALEALGSAP